MISSFDRPRCLILRVNGELSLLDLDDGRERELTDSVELFWVTCGQSEEKTNLIEEVSWLDYGHRGMQVNSLWQIYFRFECLLCSTHLIHHCRFGIRLQVLTLSNKKISCRYIWIVV